MRRHFPQEQEPWLADPFKSLDSKSLKALLETAPLSEYDEGDRIPSVRNAVVRVESGLLKLAVTSGDRNLAVALFGPGNAILSPLFHPWDRELYFIEAQEPTEVRVIPQKAVLDAAAAHPEFARSLMQQMSWGAWAMMSTIAMLAFHPLPRRVSQVLLNLAAMFGRVDEKGNVRISLRFTQEELAELAGARRETLSTVLQDFREDDILDLRYARIDIKNLDALARMAGAEPWPFLLRGLERLRR
jgi:CRP-like cAMP-binding protein